MEYKIPPATLTPALPTPQATVETRVMNAATHQQDELLASTAPPVEEKVGRKLDLKA